MYILYNYIRKFFLKITNNRLEEIEEYLKLRKECNTNRYNM